MAPGATSSSPVDRIATRGRRRTASSPWPDEASSPMSRALRARPAGTSVWPTLKSMPASRMKRPGGPTSLRVTTPPDSSASSCRPMTSAPSGITAPVKMRMHSPGPSDPPNRAPARDSPILRSLIGPSVTSAERRAYPSMAEAGSGGWFSRAARSSAVTRPWAAVIGTVSAVSTGIAARMRARASSTEISPASGVSNFGLVGVADMGAMFRRCSGRRPGPAPLSSAHEFVS